MNINSRLELARFFIQPVILCLSLVLFTVALLAMPTPVQAEITTNVDDRVKVRVGWTYYNWRERVFVTWVKVKNVSSAEITPPLRIAITGVKRDRFSLVNADGIDSNGSSYVDINLSGATLGVGERSRWTRLEFKKNKRPRRDLDDDWRDDDDDDDDDWRGNKWRRVAHGFFRNHRHPHKRWRHHRGPVKFDFEILGGSSAATSAPTSFPYGLAPATGDIGVLFRVNLLSDGSVPPASVFLRNLTSGTEAEMADDGVNGDITAGDGIYVVNQTIDTNTLMAGDCLTYVSATTSVQGFEVVSGEYNLCATNLPQVIGDSDTSPANQVQFNGTPTVGDEVLVILSPGATEGVLQDALKQTGGQIIGTALLNGLYQVRFPSTLTPSELTAAINLFASVDGVANAGPNYIGSYTTIPSDAMYASQHALQLVSTDNLAAGTPKHVWDANAIGSGITVTVLDSGVDATHPDLAGKVVTEIFAGANTDTFGHGTEMAGIIAANTDNAIGVAAVARAASIESIVVSVDAAVTQAEMIAGFSDAASPVSAGQIVNAAFSIFGPLVANAGMCGAIDTLISGGAIVINSAGDDNNSVTGVWPAFCNDPALDGLLNAQQPGDVISTANKTHFIVVGGSNCSSGACAVDAKTPTSNFGAWVDIGAPGNNVETTTVASADPTLYRAPSGTSVSTALVSGAAAVLRSCGVASNQVFNSLDLGATVAVTADFNRINLYNSLEAENTAPTGVGLSNNLVNENTATGAGFSIGNLSTTDATVCDAHSYAVIGGADAASFSIGGAAGDQLVLAAGTLNFETKSSYAVTVQATDFFGLTTAVLPFTVNVADLDEAPSISAAVRNIDENEPNGTNVGAPIAASDEDAGASLVYAITAGNTSGAFSINGSGQIIVANSGALDFETTPVFNLTVEVTDNGDVPPLSNSAAVTVNLNDVAEGPPAFPDPVLVFDRVEDSTNGVGDPVRRWFFNVSNSGAYPLELFAPTSAYGPCGLNPTPSRTWVDFFDAGTDNRLFGFCALGDPANLNGIWFGFLGTSPGVFPPAPPAGVYIELIDRSTTPETRYRSNTVSGLPNP